ncbi:hypothetical protein MALU111345_01790 [Marinicrinis lubricantis]
MLAALVHHSGHEQFERPEFNWDMASIPTYEENPGIGGQAYPEYAGIASFSENKDAAMEIIKYMVSKEFQLEFSKRGFMPVLTDGEVQAAYGTDAFQGKNQTAVFHLPFAPVMIKTPYDNDVERALTGKKNDLALGKMDINTLLRTAKEEADLKISQNSGN